MEVLPDRQSAEYTRRLHLDAHATGHARKGWHLRDVGSGEQDRAGAWRVGADDQLEQRALAGSVRADEAMDLPILDREVVLLHGKQAAEALADAAGLDQGGHRLSFLQRRP